MTADLFCNPRHKHIVSDDRRPRLGGVKLEGDVGFRAPDDGLRCWIVTADDADEQDCCAIEGAVEFTLLDMIECWMGSFPTAAWSDEREREGKELVRYLRYLADWIEAGGNGRW